MYSNFLHHRILSTKLSFRKKIRKISTPSCWKVFCQMYTRWRKMVLTISFWFKAYYCFTFMSYGVVAYCLIFWGHQGQLASGKNLLFKSRQWNSHESLHFLSKAERTVYYVWTFNPTVLEFLNWQMFVLSPRNLNSHHWYTAAPIYLSYGVSCCNVSARCITTE